MGTTCTHPRGEPISGFGYTPAELSVLAILRQYCATFALPERQSWISAMSLSLSGFGEERGPQVCVAALGAMQAVRRARVSTFLFNPPDCDSCSRHVTGHERLLMAILRNAARGKAASALAQATLLCEGNDATGVVRAMQALAVRALATPASGPLSRSAA